MAAGESEHPDDMHIDFYSPELIIPDDSEDIVPWYISGTKRAVDVLGSSIGIVLTSPLLLFSAAYMYTEPGVDRKTRRNIFYSQERLGRGGKPFSMYKIRTMVPPAEGKDEMDGDYNVADAILHNYSNDRITKRGRIIRKGFDELPQLLNVFLGDMSLVGDRPLCLKDSHELAKRGYTAHSGKTKPGIAGYSQNKMHEVQAIDDVDGVCSYARKLNPDISDAELDGFRNGRFESLDDAKLYLAMGLYGKYSDDYGKSPWYRQSLTDTGIILETPIVIATGRHG